jgi:hypothetical protein
LHTATSECRGLALEPGTAAELTHHKSQVRLTNDSTTPGGFIFTRNAASDFMPPEPPKPGSSAGANELPAARGGRLPPHVACDRTGRGVRRALPAARGCLGAPARCSKSRHATPRWAQSPDAAQSSPKADACVGGPLRLGGADSGCVALLYPHSPNRRRASWQASSPGSQARQTSGRSL